MGHGHMSILVMSIWRRQRIIIHSQEAMECDFLDVDILG